MSHRKALKQECVKPVPLLHGRKHHVYCSPSCKGADDLVQELNALTPIRSTNQLGALADCEYFLLYLTSATWTSGEMSAQFAYEVCEAHRQGVCLLLAHEFPSMIDGASAPQRGACAFNDFWRGDNGKRASQALHIPVHVDLDWLQQR